ncbi:DNA-binding transcription factor cat8 [Diplodia seriata]|uniref:DNA-binding transcription factor cat8 n=1 Tax=Diplodia seriata TaxID=420778 RepID=A0ABR3C0K9_9PEZI
MPGILPMKVIKVGTNSQTRIAQACDRCRSKKIRCDGIRPSCSQCTNVGFECKTSDKLSRRAFPRGYTESLEERVRILESEIRELKELLDEKDEKIDMLSRMHSNSPGSIGRRPSPSPSPISPREEVPDKDDLFKIQQSPILLDDGSSDSYFVGTSSGRTLIDSFYRRVQETGRSLPSVRPEAFLETDSKPQQTRDLSTVSFKAPPRLVSDQLINIFFQEWAPLFPVLHRPAFLTLYDEFVNSSEPLTDMKALAQLNLVFGIAALANNSPDKSLVESVELQWHAALNSFIDDTSLVTLQCLVLAQIFCLQKADYNRLLKYKGIAVSLSHRLGLHQSQKRFTLGVLTSETRKKVFWTQYTLDCFTAAQLGQPKQLREEDIHCEFPVDADDEYITEKGFLPSLPGEFTKLSSALALFRAARILGTVLCESYPAATSHEISLRKMAAQSDELDEWNNNLASHLKLQFVQDKPSTNIVSSRSPILSLAYQYIRSLIWRPAVCANIGGRASAATLAVAGASKATVQILQLLEERSMCFALCLNKHEMLVTSGFGLMFQSLDLDQDSKLIKENQKLMAAIVGFLERSQSPGSAVFRKVAKATVSPNTEQRPSKPSSIPNNMRAPQDALRSTQKHLKAIASRFSPNRQQEEVSNDIRRATLPNLSTEHSNQSGVSINSVHSEPPHARSEPTMSPLSHRASLGATPSIKVRRPSAGGSTLNLDYLSFGTESQSNTYSMAAHLKSETHSPGDWERLLSGIDNGQTNIYDSIYGGAPVDALGDVPPLSATSDGNLGWSPSVWTVGPPDQQPPQSVLSFSDESLTSGSNDFDCDFGSGNSDSYRGLVIPDLSPSANGIHLDGSFGL